MYSCLHTGLHNHMACSTATAPNFYQLQRRGTRVCGSRCTASRCIALVPAQGLTQCCLCTLDASRLCHHHRKRMSWYNPRANEPRPVQPFYSTVERLTWPNVSRIGTGLELRQSGIPNSGMGVFSTRYFKRGDVVTFYDGLVFQPSATTLTRLLNENRADGTPKSSHLLKLREFEGSTWYIDGVRSTHQTRGRGAGSLINSARGLDANISCGIHSSNNHVMMHYATELHSSGHRRGAGNVAISPNDTKSVWAVNMYAKRDIVPGEELCWYYPVSG